MCFYHRGGSCWNYSRDRCGLFFLKTAHGVFVWKISDICKSRQNYKHSPTYLAGRPQNYQIMADIVSSILNSFFAFYLSPQWDCLKTNSKNVPFCQESISKETKEMVCVACITLSSSKVSRFLYGMLCLLFFLSLSDVTS